MNDDVKETDMMWTLREARKVASSLNTHLESIGYHVGLTGSVLFCGRSSKDLDLIIYPRSTSQLASPARLFRRIQSFGFQRRLTAAQVKRLWKNDRRDEKCVEVWKTNDDRRVDLIFL